MALRRPRGDKLLEIYKGKKNQLWYKPITIRGHQQKHFDKLLRRLAKRKHAADVSPMGDGKTWIATALAQHLDLLMMVVTVSAGTTVWNSCIEQTVTMCAKNCDDHNKDYVMSYETLRGVKNHQLSHGLLIRTDTDNGPEFEPTQKLRDLIDKGILVIFDECQKFKNDCEISGAATAIFDAVAAADSRSRIMMLSGSMADSPDNIINILRVMRAIRHPKLYIKENGTLYLEGISEVFDFGDSLNKVATDKFIANNLIKEDEEFTPDDAKQYVLKFWQEVIQDELCSCMDPDPERHTKSKQYFFNLICPLSDADSDKLNKALTKLSRALRGPDERAGRGPRNRQEIGAITNCLIEIQEAKIDVMVNQALLHLESRFFDEAGNYITPKICLMSDYSRVWDVLMQKLAAYQPLLLTGKTKNVQQIVDAFNEDNDCCRVLIVSSDVGSVSLSLDDKYGTRSRIAFRMPGFKAMYTFQGGGRFNRADTRGVNIFYLVYGYSPRDMTAGQVAMRNNSATEAVEGVEGIENEDIVTTEGDDGKKKKTNSRTLDSRRSSRRKREEEEQIKATHGVAETRIFNSMMKKGLFIKSIHQRKSASSESNSGDSNSGESNSGSRETEADDGSTDNETVSSGEDIIETIETIDQAKQRSSDIVFPGEYEDILVKDDNCIPFLPKEWKPVLDPNNDGYYFYHVEGDEGSEQMLSMLREQHLITVAERVVAEAEAAEAAIMAEGYGGDVVDQQLTSVMAEVSVA